MKKAKERPDGIDRWTSNGYGLTFGDGWKTEKPKPPKEEKKDAKRDTKR